MSKLLELKNLTITSGEKTIIRDLSLTLKAGEIHAMMGPNGSGKSTLASTIMGHPSYQVKAGHMIWQGKKDIVALSPDKRAQEGIFLAFQYPREIPGVSLAHMTRVAANARKDAPRMTPSDFLKKIKGVLASLHISDEFAKRSLNENASGGEKKRLEMVQLEMLSPQLAILDEIDSGLDIDALKNIAAMIKKQNEQGTTFLLITHYQRLLQYVKPTHVHVLVDGNIAKSGGAEIFEALEKEGYEKFKK